MHPRTHRIDLAQGRKGALLRKDKIPRGPEWPGLPRQAPAGIIQPSGHAASLETIRDAPPPRLPCPVDPDPCLSGGHRGPSPAWAWGRLGHRVVARLAERYLTDKAKAEIKTLLEPGELLADASTWADEVRGKMRKSAPWHYVDVPLDEPRYDDRFAGDDSKKGFIVPKLTEFLNVLGNPDSPLEERRLALRFVVHLVEDLHQPCHVGDNHDRGGNDTQFRWFTRGSNLHKVWDTGILERASGDEGPMAHRPDRDGHARGPPEDPGRRGRGLGDGIPTGGPGSLPGPGNGPEDQAGRQAGR